MQQNPVHPSLAKRREPNTFLLHCCFPALNSGDIYYWPMKHTESSDFRPMPMAMQSEGIEPSMLIMVAL